MFVAAPAVAEEAPPAELTTQVEETTAPDGIVVPAEVTVVPVEETDTAEEPVVPTAGAEAPLEEVVEADVVEDAPAAPASAQRVAVLAVDTTAPTVISAVQKFEENVQNNGQIAVTLTFSEPVVKPGQGWNGSGTTWTKVYYSHNKSYSVTFVDLAGNPGQTSFTIDKLAPTVTSEKQRTELKNGELRLAVTLTFSEAVDPASLPQGWYGSGVTFTKVFYSSKPVSVGFTDFAGNPGSYSFVSDMNAPMTPVVAPTNLLPASGSVVSLPTTTSWSSVPGATGYQTQTSLDGVTWFGPFGDAAGFPNPIVWGAGSLPDGGFFWQVRAINSVGETGPWSASSFLTVDTVAPVVTITSPVAGTVVASPVAFAATIADANPAAAYLTVDGNAVDYQYSLTNKNYTFSIAGLSEGTHTAKFEVRDAAGNKTAASVATVTFTVDAGAPVVTIVKPGPVTYVKPGTPVEFEATVVERGSWSSLLSIDGVRTDYKYGTTASPYRYTVPTTGWANGSKHVLTYEARDLPLGQKDAALSVKSVEVWADSARPGLTIVAPTAGQFVASSTLPVTVSATDNLSLGRIAANLYNASNTTLVKSIGSTSAASALGGTAATRTWNVAGLADGTYTVRATVTDAAGNSQSTSSTVIIDTTAPAAVTLTSPANGGVTPDRHPTFRWSPSEAGASYELAYTSVDPINDVSVLANPTVVTSSSNEVVVFNLPDTTYFWQVRAVDAAGNAGAWSEIWSVRVDTQGPAAVTLTSPANAGATPDRHPTFRWSPSEAGASYELAYTSVDPINDVSVLANPTVVTSTTNEVVVFNLPDTTYFWQVRAVDASGNTGAWSEIWSVRVDTQAPAAVTLTSPADLSTDTDGGWTFTWTAPEAGDLSYDFELTTDAPAFLADGRFDGDVASATIATTSIPAANAVDGVYYWHVRATDSVGNIGAWSPVWSVTVENPVTPETPSNPGTPIIPTTPASPVAPPTPETPAAQPAAPTGQAAAATLPAPQSPAAAVTEALGTEGTETTDEPLGQLPTEAFEGDEAINADSASDGGLVWWPWAALLLAILAAVGTILIRRRLKVQP